MKPTQGKTCKKWRGLNIIFMDGGTNGRGYSDRWPESRVKIRCGGTIAKEWTDDRTGPIGPLGEKECGPISGPKNGGREELAGPIGPFAQPIRFENDETVFDTVCKQRFLYLNEPHEGDPQPFSVIKCDRSGLKPLPHLRQGPRPFPSYLNEWAEKNIDVHTGIKKGNTEKSI